MSKEIYLKSIMEHFDHLFYGDKKSTVRYNDRDYTVGDTIIFKEYDPKTNQYTGRFCKARITFVTKISEIVSLYPEYFKRKKIDPNLLSISFEILK